MAKLKACLCISRVIDDIWNTKLETDKKGSLPPPAEDLGPNMKFLSISFAYYSSQYVRSLEPLKDRWSEELVKIGKMVSAGSGTLKTGFSCITSNLKVRTLTLK